MQILRPPLGSGGSEGTEDVAPSKRWFLQFLFAVLFLVIGMAIFFVGGVVVRNPQLPDYLLDQIVSRFWGTKGNHNTGNEYTSGAVRNVTPPPSPQTAEEYLNLMNYDENILSPDERTIASILNQSVSLVMAGGPPVQIFSQQIIPKLQTLKPGEDVTQIQVALQECRDETNASVRSCQNGSAQVAEKLIAAGMATPMAHQVAETYGRRPLTFGTLYWPDEMIKACDSATAFLNVLSKWTKSDETHWLFTSQTLSDEFNAAIRDFNAAIKAINDRYRFM